MMRSILLASAAVLVLSQPVLADEFEQFKDQLNREAQAFAHDMMQRAHTDLENGLTRMQLYDAEERARDAALPMPSPTPAAPPSTSHDSYMEGYHDGHSDAFYGDGFTPNRY